MSNEVEPENKNRWSNFLEQKMEESSYYNGELITTPQQRLSREQKAHLLDYHPIFTGHCPECKTSMEQPDLKQGCKCSHCGWEFIWDD